MKIHIFYRHYNVQGTDFKGRPDWFTFEKSFKNLLDTLDPALTALHVVMDGDVNQNFIKDYQDRFTLHTIAAGTDISSFFQTWQIASKLETAPEDLYYFLENDYIHLPGWAEKVIELFKAYSLPHYVSLYDHNDKYTSPSYEDLVSKIITTPTHHWRTTPSTCGSFIINKKIFLEDFDIHTTFTQDHEKFLSLYEHRNRLVLTPIPGLNTHCMQGLLSPTINWEQYASRNS